MLPQLLDRATAFRAAGRFYRPVRRLALATCDAFIVFMSLVVSIFLYTRAIPLPYEWAHIFAIFGWLYGVQLFAFTAFRVHNVSFQYANVLAAVRIAVILTVAWAVTFVGLRQYFGPLWPPLIAVVQALLAIMGAIAFRLLGLIYLEIRQARGVNSRTVHALIYGAGSAGTQLALSLRNVPGVHLLGFLDDDPRLRRTVIYGYPVLDAFDHLERLMLTHTVDQVLIAIPSLSGERLRALRRRCRQLKVSVKVIPSIYELYNRRPDTLADSIREPMLEDLLRRKPHELPASELRAHFSGRRALVVGGAGSIGSELVNQLLLLGASEVAVVDASELGLYQLEQRHREEPRLTLHLVDAKDRAQLDIVFALHRPEVVFHTAAYKHVHLVERNPAPAVLNNMAALCSAAQLAHQHGTKQFVFISTDKAVRPQSVMGQTKRLGELYVRSLNGRSETAFCSVRFGNVVGSSGSLIPKLVERISQGLAVEVTHPGMERYFMLIPEAVSLILEACLQANGGEIFVLDMGEPVRIVDLVREIILLLEREPGRDVPIVFTQPHPGEKLTEELFDPESERIEKRGGVYVAFSDPPEFDAVYASTERLLAAARAGHREEVLQILQDAVTTKPTVIGRDVVV